jgi:hypothetical protein
MSDCRVSPTAVGNLHDRELLLRNKENAWSVKSSDDGALYSAKAVFWTLSIVDILIKLLRFGSWIVVRRQLKRKGTNPSGRALWLSSPETCCPGPSCPSFLHENGRRSSFRNVIILLKFRRRTKSKKPLLKGTLGSHCWNTSLQSNGKRGYCWNALLRSSDLGKNCFKSDLRRNNDFGVR